MDGIISNYKTLIYLISCTLNKKIPDKRIFETLDLGELEKQSEFHMVSALVAKALSSHFNNREFFSTDDAARWSNILNNSVRRSLMFNAERKAVCDIFEKNGIWHTPLKGSVIQDFYPHFGIREMHDVDILVDSSRADNIRDLMVARGYNVKMFGMLPHDIYEKKPVYEFELHAELFAKTHSKQHEYYSNVKDRLVQKDGRKFEFIFTDEDFYIYTIAHACKHLNRGGIGLKPLVDIYVYRKAVELDESYVQAEVDKLGLKESENILRNLSDKLFSVDEVFLEEKLTDDEIATLSYMLAAGSDGNAFNKVKNEINSEDAENVKLKKLKYIQKRLFIKPYEYKISYPFFYKHKWARPFLPLVRLGKSITVKRKEVKRELEYIKKS